jgi:thioredoxin 1
MKRKMSADKELEKIKQEMLKKIMSPTTRVTLWRDGDVIELSDANFHKALSETDKPVLVDFWADWCGPCKMMAPVVHQIAKEYAGKANIAKLNVDNNQRIAAQFGVMSIPNFIVFKNGRPAGQMVGAIGKQGLVALLSRVM